MRAGGATTWRSGVGAALVAVSLLASLDSCGSSSASTRNAGDDQAFLSSVHVAAPDINAYRTDVQVERLGHAACDGFRSGATYEQLADRLVLLEGSNPLPSPDLGAVIDAAVDAYCPEFHGRIV